MAKVFSNSKTDKTYFISDSLEAELNKMKNNNQYSEMRVKIAEALNLPNYVKIFTIFANMPSLNVDTAALRYLNTQEMLSTIETNFGKDAMAYLDQFL